MVATLVTNIRSPTPKKLKHQMYPSFSPLKTSNNLLPTPVILSVQARIDGTTRQILLENCEDLAPH